MQRRIIVILTGITLLAVLFLRGWTGTSAAALSQNASASTCGKWSQVSSPNVGTSTNFLNAVAAISSSNVWAVGTEGNGHGGLTLVEHWNGKQWKVVASPNINGSLSDSLSGVAAIAANNIWAVGDYRSSIDPQGPYFTLIEHWNGSNWSVVSSPSPGPADSDLVAAASLPGTKSLWAVGFTQDQNINSQTLTEFYC